VTIGKVYLVGAGPGDPGLITAKGFQYLKQAGVVVYDRLVDEHLLDAVPAEAERVFVGKAAGAHTRTQDEINQILVAKAIEGKTVVRLKGGDPFVLGRGGEEANTLKDNSIPFEIVPGITSAIAVPAYAGIPVTHRGVASSFAVVTGHEDPSKPDSAIAWDRLATGVDTLIFLMGMQNLAQIVGKLLEHGRPPDTAVAVIKDGTTPNQVAVVGTLSNITTRVKQHHLSPPVVVVVGEVVKLREELAWFDNRPLFGKRVLVTRSRRQASSLSYLLTERGARPIELPTIDIQDVTNTTALDHTIKGLSEYHWVVFTSTNGVEAFFRRLDSLGRDARAFADLNIAAIGPATAHLLAERGIVADYVPDIYTGTALVDGFATRDITGKRFLLPRADIADTELSYGLIRLGAEVDEVTAYSTVPPTNAIARAKELLLSGEIDIITFTSSSAVSNLITAFDGAKPETGGAMIACIGPKTAATASEAGLNVDVVAGEYTIPGLVKTIEEFLGEEVSV